MRTAAGIASPGAAPMLSRSSHAEADAAEQNYLRGVQVADERGRVFFASTFPACYDGRWPHIHFEIFDSLESAVAGDNARLTSQIALPEDTCKAVYAADKGYGKSVQNLSQVTLNSDNVFGDGWDAELATVTGDPNTAISVALTIGVADKSANTPAAGGAPPGGGPPPNGGPPGPPPGDNSPTASCRIGRFAGCLSRRCRTLTPWNYYAT